ncbi:ATP-binding protein [Spirulina major CS-329]|uniref:PAS domain-containing sensor histidine kinase n=1 Tax=Spirulina TaxID=1154 RepID=UPI00232E39CA|nr:MULTISPECIES: ATP-binding protein [Spirulina]MDB9493200.1 ATP-binding protein [Spirulina subsalsa CS-330]MDB9503537.1 ATP-binding protein [Spirulina major CS-329]
MTLQSPQSDLNTSLHPAIAPDPLPQQLAQFEAHQHRWYEHLPGCLFQLHRTPDGQLSLRSLVGNSMRLLGCESWDGEQWLAAWQGEQLRSWHAAIAYSAAHHTHLTWSGWLQTPQGRCDVWVSAHPERQADGATLWDGMIMAQHSPAAATSLTQPRLNLRHTLHFDEPVLRAIYEFNPAAVMFLDAQGFLDCNQATLQLFRCSDRDQFCAYHPSQLSPPQQANQEPSDHLANYYIQAALTDGNVSFEWLHQRCDGTLFEAEVSLFRVHLAGVDCLQAIVRDITAQKQAAKTLADREQMLMAIVENAPIWIWKTDVNGHMHFINRTFCRDLGITPDAVYNVGHYKEAFGEQAVRNCLVSDAICLQQDEVYITPEVFPFVDGNLHHLETLKIRLKNQEGEVTGLVGLAVDMTERIHVEAKLRDYTNNLEKTLTELHHTQNQLIQSEKMSSLGQLVAGIAHEINNPVNFIYGNLRYANEYTENLLEVIHAYQQHYPNITGDLEELVEDVDLDFLIKDLPKLLKSMHVGAERIRGIVTSLRSFSRLDESEIKAVNLHDGLDSTMMILNNRLKSKNHRPDIKVIKNYGDLPQVECYAGQINQVLMNFLANAIDAIDDHQPSEPCLTITTDWVDDQTVMIAITDNGHGMDAATQTKLFTPFFTTKPVGQGTGLGLSISYQIIVDKHGGKLEVESTPGEGSTFKVLLPIQIKRETV